MFSNEHYAMKVNYTFKIIILALTLFILSYIGRYNYLLFHTSVELFSIIIAIIISIIALNTYMHKNDNNILSFLGISYLFIAGFDLIHTLSYKGMGVFGWDDANIPTQFWITARYMESISILVALMYFNKKPKFIRLICTYIAFFILLLLSILYYKIFPQCYVDGAGLTLFKKTSEYIIIAILSICTLIIIKNKTALPRKTYTFLACSLMTKIFSEVFFVLYIGVYDLSNMVGHILKFVSFFYMYKAIVEENLKLPYKELLKNERQYHSLIEVLPNAVMILGGNKILFINESAKELLEVSNAEEVLNKNIDKFLNIDKGSLLQFEDYSDNDIEKNSICLNGKLISFNNSILDVEVSASSCMFNNSLATLLIIRDVSVQEKLKRLQEKAVEDERRLREALEYDKIKSTFFSNLSHELRTPLNVILSSIQLMELLYDGNESVMSDRKFRKNIKTIKQNCFRLLRLINNLIDVTRIDSGYYSMKLQNINIVYIIEEIVQSVADYIKSKGIEIVFDTDAEEKIIACDVDMIERIMLNLLSNAIKFTGKNGFIMVNIHTKEDSVVIYVKDTGIGIPEEKLGVIFNRFTQVDHSLSRRHEGSGIGLSLVKSLVEMHGGKISVISKIGEGSQFTIELPRRTVEHDIVCDKDRYTRKNVEIIDIEFSDIYLLNSETTA